MTPCWLWAGRKSKSGYGERFFRGKKKLAHRVAFFLEYGYWPTEIAHRCHTRACVRPSHLRDSSHTDNVRESRATKLTVEQVQKIRSTYTGAYGERIRLMRKYKIGNTQFRRIIRHESWTV